MISRRRLALLALAASAQAHIEMTHPVPFDPESLNNSPLFYSDFPCKQRPGVYNIAEMNYFTADEPQNVDFMGTAVHAGGSCQFSITTDLEPSLTTKWAVIHSIEGNCPAVNQAGNILGENANYPGQDRYPVKIPKQVPNGLYTFAWSWINNQGGRGEFYMNCAPILVSGGAESNDPAALEYLNNLPPMFVANLQAAPGGECITSTLGEGGEFDWEYENPGDSVVRKPNLKAQTWANTAGCASMTVMGAGSGSMSAPQTELVGLESIPTAGLAQGGVVYGGEVVIPTGSPDVPTSAAASPPAATSAPVAPSNPGGIFAPGASSVAAPTVEAPSSAAEIPQTIVSTTLVTRTAAQPASTTVVPPAGTGAPVPPSSGAVSCIEDGKIVCIGTSQWGTCNFGQAIPQELAAGTECVNGSIEAIKARRHARAHMHRRHGSHL